MRTINFKLPFHVYTIPFDYDRTVCPAKCFGHCRPYAVPPARRPAPIQLFSNLLKTNKKKKNLHRLAWPQRNQILYLFPSVRIAGCAQCVSYSECKHKCHCNGTTHSHASCKVIEAHRRRNEYPKNIHNSNISFK